MRLTDSGKYKTKNKGNNHMVDKIIIAGSNLNLINNIELIRAVPEYGLCNDPKATIVDGEVIANFDYYLDAGLEPNWCLKEMLGDMYILFNRQPKQVQSVILKRLGINHPITAFPISFNSEQHHDHNVYSACGASIIDLSPRTTDHLVIKTGNQAEGNGQVLLDYTYVSAFANAYLGRRASPIPNPTFMGTLGGKESRDDMIYLQADNTVLIQGKVNPIIELRMLFSASNEIIVEDRDVNIQQGWQARGGNGKVIYSGQIVDFVAKYITDLEHCQVDMLDTTLWCEFIEKLIKLISVIGYPFGSIDIYLELTESGIFQAGVFEYCPQFSHSGIDVRATRRLISSGLTKVIKGIPSENKVVVYRSTFG